MKHLLRGNLNLPARKRDGGGAIADTNDDMAFTLINENTSLTSSDYYFTDALTSDIEVNCSNLGIGDHIFWFNLSTKSVVFSGLNSIDSTSIPANKGVKVSSGDFIEFFLKDASNNIKKIQGTHTIDWVPGYTPPVLTFTYASPGDTNGIIYYLGATKYGASFLNPDLRGEITASASSTIGAPRVARGTFTKTNDGSGSTEGAWHSTSGSNHWISIQFNNSQMARITRFELWRSAQHNLGSYVGSNCQFQAWDGTAWITLLTFSTGDPTRYLSNVFTNENFYNLYRFLIPSPQYAVIGDIEFYGDLQ